MSLRCWILGHTEYQTDYDEWSCRRCGYSNPGDFFWGRPIWRRLPARLKSWWRHKTRFHQKCPDCGNRQFIRKCNQDCIPF